jgi:hypothetical protein
MFLIIFLLDTGVIISKIKGTLQRSKENKIFVIFPGHSVFKKSVP